MPQIFSHTFGEVRLIFAITILLLAYQKFYRLYKYRMNVSYRNIFLDRECQRQSRMYRSSSSRTYHSQADSHLHLKISDDDSIIFHDKNYTNTFLLLRFLSPKVHMISQGLIFLYNCYYHQKNSRLFVNHVPTCAPNSLLTHFSSVTVFVSLHLCTTFVTFAKLVVMSP